jgi:hypothetical protein
MMKLQWHNMICPSCLSDRDLKVVVETFSLLTAEGTENVGDEEWDENSLCLCDCGLSGPVSMFEWSGSGCAKVNAHSGEYEVDLKEGDEITFELQACHMAKDPNGDGYCLADSIDAPQEAIEFIDVIVTRRHDRLGVIDIIEEIEYLPPAASTGDVVAQLEAKYKLEAEWV